MFMLMAFDIVELCGVDTCSGSCEDSMRCIMLDGTANLDYLLPLESKGFFEFYGSKIDWLIVNVVGYSFELSIFVAGAFFGGFWLYFCYSR